MAELKYGRRTTPWVGLAVGIGMLILLLACCLGVVLIPPNLVKIHSRPRLAEAQTNLKYAFTAEKAYFAEKNRYDECVETVGFFPEPNNRYRYFFSQTGDSKLARDPVDGGPHTGILADSVRYPAANNGLLSSAIPPSLLSTAGIEGTCPACDITIVAAGDIDSDPTIDVWSISTKLRVIDGGVIPAGISFRHVDDSEN